MKELILFLLYRNFHLYFYPQEGTVPSFRKIKVHTYWAYQKVGLWHFRPNTVTLKRHFGLSEWVVPFGALILKTLIKTKRVRRYGTYFGPKRREYGI